VRAAVEQKSNRKGLRIEPWGATNEQLVLTAVYSGFYFLPRVVPVLDRNHLEPVLFLLTIKAPTVSRARAKMG